MTVLMRVGTLKANLKDGRVFSAPDGTYNPSEDIIYNPAKIIAISPAATGVWRVQLKENRWFLVKDIDGKPDYGVYEKGWLE